MKSLFQPYCLAAYLLGAVVGGFTMGVILHAASAPPPVVQDVFAGLEAQTDQAKGRENLPKDIVLSDAGIPLKFYVRFDYTHMSINPADARDTFARSAGSDGLDLMADKEATVTIKDPFDGTETVYHPYEAALILAAVAKQKWLERNPPPLPQDRRRKALREAVAKPAQPP